MHETDTIVTSGNGTYEGGLLGLKLNFSNDSIEMKTEFAFSSHLGAVKSIAAHQTVMASGSADETIQLVYHNKFCHAFSIFDLAIKKQVGTMNGHEGTVTALDFFGKKHMISGGEDGKLNLWRCTDWELLTELKGHKDSIIDAKFHPSGRMCLSVSRDMTLRLWDLMRATCPISAKLKDLPRSVQWSPSGQSYAILFADKVRVVRVATNDAVDVQAVALDKESLLQGKRPKLSCFSFVSENNILLGTDDGDVQLLTLEGPIVAQKARLLSVFRPDESEKKHRVKALTPVRALADGFDFAAIESEGHIRVYSVPLKELLADESGQPDLFTPSLQHGAELRIVSGSCTFDRSRLLVMFPTERIEEPEFEKAEEEEQPKKKKEEEKPKKRAAEESSLDKKPAKKAKKTKAVELEAEEEIGQLIEEEEIDTPIVEVKKGAPVKQSQAPKGSSRAALASIADEDDDFEAIKKLKAASQLGKQQNAKSKAANKVTAVKNATKANVQKLQKKVGKK